MGALRQCGVRTPLKPRYAVVRKRPSVRRGALNSKLGVSEPLRFSTLSLPLKEIRPSLVVGHTARIDPLALFALVKNHLPSGSSKDGILQFTFVICIFYNIERKVWKLRSVFSSMRLEPREDVPSTSVSSYPN